MGQDSNSNSSSRTIMLTVVRTSLVKLRQVLRPEVNFRMSMQATKSSPKCMIRCWCVTSSTRISNITHSVPCCSCLLCPPWILSASAVPDLTHDSTSGSATLTARREFANIFTQGQRVTATLRSGIVYEGILSTVNDTDLSVCLRLARQIDPSSTSSSPTAVKPSLLVSARDIIDLSADNIDFAAFEQPANGTARPLSPAIKDPGGASIMAALMNGSPAAPPTANPDTFRTDVDISSRGGPKDNRELQKWGASSAWGAGGDGGIGGSSLEGDDATFGGLESSASGKGGKAWDQFAVNEKLFGTKTNYQEELYTTKLDKSGADYRARERKAERLAQEIQSVSEHT